MVQLCQRVAQGFEDATVTKLVCRWGPNRRAASGFGFPDDLIDLLATVMKMSHTIQIDPHGFFHA